MGSGGDAPSRRCPGRSWPQAELQYPQAPVCRRRTKCIHSIVLLEFGFLLGGLESPIRIAPPEQNGPSVFARNPQAPRCEVFNCRGWNLSTNKFETRPLTSLSGLLFCPCKEGLHGGAGGAAALRSWDTAVMSCAGANGLVRRMLLGTPCDAHSDPAAPVM